MKQTAVEWLEDNLIGNPFSEKDFAHNVNVFNQAKEMEKDQIEDAYWNGGVNWDEGIDGLTYYNETYGDDT
jgi:hypothetical protein